MLVSDNSTDVGADITRILAGETVSFRTAGVLEPRFQQISGFLYRLLGELDIGYLHELTLVLLREIAGNCAKANAKRLFFKTADLDINDPGDYRLGIKRFGGEVLERWDDFMQQNGGSEYYIDLTIALREGDLLISVSNNAPILPQEWERIEARLETFRKHATLESAMDHIRDESEGAGFGIVLSLMMLRNAGISPNSLKIEATPAGSITNLMLPRRPGKPQARREFRERVLAEMEGLPTFPEHLTRLIKLCDSENASVHRIAEEIQKDPALTSQLLRMVNSAGYMHRWQNPTLADAVKIIGLKVIRNLLMVTGARNVINSHFRVRDLETLWEDSNRVSYFARRLAKHNATVAEQAALAGLLYNLGRIVLTSLSFDLVDRLQKIIGRGRKSTVIEEIGLGISHAEIGALLAKKWKFPDALITAIRYQQRPLQAPAEYRDLVRAVYLAIRLKEASQSVDDYFIIESEILNEFDIHSPQEFLERARALDALYNSAE